MKKISTPITYIKNVMKRVKYTPNGFNEPYYDVTLTSGNIYEVILAEISPYNDNNEVIRIVIYNDNNETQLYAVEPVNDVVVFIDATSEFRDETIDKILS